MRNEETAQAQAEPAPGQGDAPGGTIITRLAELPERTLLDEAALADTLGVTKRTVRRMVGRYELPPPVRFAGRAHWQAGRVLAHFDAQAERAAREAERAAKKFRETA